MATKRALRELVGFRSGDKANLVNVALFSDDAELHDAVCAGVTPATIGEHLGVPNGDVRCYRADNVLGLNIVIQNALGGGGPATLFGDNLGKSFASRILDIEIDVPQRFAEATRPRPDVSWATDILGKVPHS